MVTTPSFSTSTDAPVVSTMLRIVLPPGPMSAPILSTGMLTRVMRGALGFSSVLGSASVPSMWLRMKARPSFAWASACRNISCVMPETLMSICRAVMPSLVPATLKSMSPKKSSTPWMSVSTWKLPSSSVISPMATPETGREIGTPASISAIVLPQTLPIEVLPFEPSASETTRKAYGKSASSGMTGASARSASAP